MGTSHGIKQAKDHSVYYQAATSALLSVLAAPHTHWAEWRAVEIINMRLCSDFAVAALETAFSYI